MWNNLWISTRAQLNNNFFLLFDCKSRNQHQQVTWQGDQEYIFSCRGQNMLVASGDPAPLEHSLLKPSKDYNKPHMATCKDILQPWFIFDWKYLFFYMITLVWNKAFCIVLHMSSTLKVKSTTWKNLDVVHTTNKLYNHVFKNKNNSYSKYSIFWICNKLLSQVFTVSSQICLAFILKLLVRGHMTKHRFTIFIQQRQEGSFTTFR